MKKYYFGFLCFVLGACNSHGQSKNALLFLSFTALPQHDTPLQIHTIPHESVSDPSVTTTPTTHRLQPKVEWNAVAAVLSGMPEKVPEPWASVRNLSAFRTYAQQIEEMWKPVTKKKNVLENWVKIELKDINQNCNLLFYPFSGPDFLHVHLLFPGCRNVVMIGLEPPGTLPEMTTVLQQHPDKFFQKMREALTHILTLSFFRTKSMKEDLFGKDVPEINGTLALILFMMSRAEYSISNIERVQLDVDGQVVPWTGVFPEIPEVVPESSKQVSQKNISQKRARKSRKRIPYEGLRYTYTALGDSHPRTLTYFSCNLADGAYRDFDGITRRPDLQKFLKGLTISATYIKAASYLMHESGFSWIRTLILEHSPQILQDDSGIPVSFFDEKKWILTLYGFYDVPIQLFIKYTQEELARRYANRKSVKPLPFGIGYKVYPGRSNLQLAVRRR